MSQFAKIENNLVTNTIVADAVFIKSLPPETDVIWVELTEPITAGISYTYNPNTKKFTEPKPYPSWTLNSSTNTWEAPVAKPTTTEAVLWDEKTKSWKTV